jgi:selenocysteine lyase/cysteine desulfurase
MFRAWGRSLVGMTLEVQGDFGLPQDRVWLNAAHQGPLPTAAADAVAEMIKWKLQPHHLQPHDAFTHLPEHLRASIARLIHADVSQWTFALLGAWGHGLMS